MVNLFDPETLVKGYGCVALTCDQNNYFVENVKTFPYVRTKKYLSKVMDIKDIPFLITFGSAVWVKEKLIDIDTGKVYLKLGYRVGDDEKEKIFDSSILNQWGIKELLTDGIRFYDRNSADVVSYLIMDEENAPVKRVYSKLGWSSITDDSIVFKSGTVHDTKGAPDALYRGNLQLSPHGSLDKWLEMVKREVLNNTALEFVMLLGFSAPILSYLNIKFDIGAMLFNLSNRTSKGKTTAAMLAASVFSNPVLNKGTAITYNSTENAIVQFISEAMGHPIILDEVAISTCSDFTKLMYTICNGRSKMRLNGDATQKPVYEFNSVIISTAEFDLLNDDSPPGLKARVFEVKEQLTVSADNSDNIKRCIIENYALAGGPFMETVLKDIENVSENYETEKKNLISKIKDKKELTERIFSKLSIIILSCRYFNQTFPDTQIDIDALTDYVINLEASISENMSPEDRFLEILKIEYMKNSQNFLQKNGSSNYTVPQNCVGEIIVHNWQTDIIILEPEFVRICEKYNIGNPKTLLKNLKALDILEGEKDRLYKRMVIWKEFGRQKCYCFKIDTRGLDKDSKAKSKSVIDLDSFDELNLSDI